MKNLKEEFGARLKELRKGKKYTQETLAEKIDLSQRQLVRIENGQNFPSVETINKIMDVLDVELETLFDFSLHQVQSCKKGLGKKSEEELINNKLYNEIIQKINLYSSNNKKLLFINLAIEALQSKKSLEELKIFIKGMDISS